MLQNLSDGPLSAGRWRLAVRVADRHGGSSKEVEGFGDDVPGLSCHGCHISLVVTEGRSGQKKRRMSAASWSGLVYAL
jgi:hypothetical protein